MKLADLLWPRSLDDHRDQRIGELEARAEEALQERDQLAERVIASISRTNHAIERGTREELVRVRHYLRGDEA
jgi:hypothetical protein